MSSIMLYPCLYCSNSVEDHHEAIACDACGGWQHIHCQTGISRHTYKRMVRGILNQPFTCSHCQQLQDIEDADSTTSIIERLNQSLFEDTQETWRSEPDESFRVNTTIIRPPELQEAAIAEPEPTNQVLQERPQTFEIIEGGSNKGGDLLLDSRGFSFTRKNSRGRCTYWWCHIRTKSKRCPATVVQKGGEFKCGTHQHDHPPNYHRRLDVKIFQKYYVLQTKRRAQTEIFTSAKSMIEEAFEEEITQTDTNLPSIDLLSRRVNRARQKVRPPEPRGEDFELHLNAVPENYLREDLRVDGARHLIFSTDRQLQVLSQAKTWYVDGTFKVLRPQDPFIQLYSVHAFLRNENDETKQVPLIFVFMSRRRKRDYKKVFKSIKSLISPSIPQSVILDFERAAWAALKRVLPDVKISGCAFHWTQSLWRKLQNLGLSTNYREDEGTRKFVRKLMALPLLPENHIQETFQILQQKASAPIEPLMNYINATWIAGYWNPSDWSVYGKGIRTNNDCEGWHRRLNFRSSGPPPFYSLIDLLHKEANRLPIQIQLVSEKRLKKRQNKQYLSVQRKIFDLWCKYEEQTISTSRLLKDLSGVYIPSGL